MAKITKKISPEENANGEIFRPKVLIFATDALVAGQMAVGLKNRDVGVRFVNDERKLLEELERIDPDLILLQLNASITSPLDQIVGEIFKWMRSRARSVNKFLNTPSQYLWQHAKVVLFESESQINPTDSLSAQIADTDETIRLCQLLGDVKYIGVYSPFSFIAKIWPFLENLYG